MAFISIMHAQDIHFSQIMQNPIFVNPSNTGNYKEEWRFTNTYRSQARALTEPYVTYSSAFDHQVYVYTEKFSVGGYIYHDYSGYATLATTAFYGLVSYHKKLKKNELHIGYQLGGHYKSYKSNKTTFSEQYDIRIGKFNSQMPLNEPIQEDNIYYPDMNLGLGWERTFKNIKMSLGYSIFHFNNPKLSFTDEMYRNPLRQSALIALGLKAGKKANFNLFSYYSAQKANNEIIYGISNSILFDSTNGKNKSVFYGIALRDGLKRNTDAFNVLAGIAFHRSKIGLSYDFNLSDISKRTGDRMALEITLIYMGPDYTLFKKKLNCKRL